MPSFLRKMEPPVVAETPLKVNRANKGAYLEAASCGVVYPAGQTKTPRRMKSEVPLRQIALLEKCVATLYT